MVCVYQILVQVKPDINEADLRRVPNANVMTREELLAAVADASRGVVSGSSSHNVLKLGGPLVDEVIEFIQRVSK